ncbi:MAG: hypothetical protein PVG73_03280, partial [Desulfobacterales bacterium]
RKMQHIRDMSGNSLRSHLDLRNDEKFGDDWRQTLGVNKYRAAGVHHRREPSSDAIFRKPRRSGCAAGVTWLEKLK